MKSLLVFLLCLWAIGLWAQTPEAEANPELILGDIEELCATEFFNAQQEHRFQLDASYQDSAWKAQFRQQSGEWQARGNFLYKAHKPHYKYQLSYLTHLALGHYRFAWGEGLIFAKAQAEPEILPPSAAQVYIPQGAAIAWEYKGLRLDMGASEQERQVQKKDGFIHTIPKSESKLWEYSHESLHYAALGYSKPCISLGSLYYRQKYNTAFAPALGDSLLSLWDSHIALKLGQHEVRTEWLWQAKPAYSLYWKQENEHFGQELSYKYRGIHQKPVYAARLNRLDNSAGRREIATKLSYKPSLGWYCELQATLNSPQAQISPKGWQNEEILKLRYRGKESRLELQFVNISRETLAAIDSLYNTSKARHQRLNLRLAQKVAKNLNLQLGIRYQYQEQQQSLLQGIYWEQSLKYQQQSFGASLGYALWNSGKYPLYIYDEHQQNFQSHASAAAALKLGGSYSWKGLKLKAQLKQNIGKTTKRKLEISNNSFICTISAALGK